MSPFETGIKPTRTDTERECRNVRVFLISPNAQAIPKPPAFYTQTLTGYLDQTWTPFDSVRFYFVHKSDLESVSQSRRCSVLAIGIAMNRANNQGEQVSMLGVERSDLHVRCNELHDMTCAKFAKFVVPIRHVYSFVDVNSLSCGKNRVGPNLAWSPTNISTQR